MTDEYARLRALNRKELFSVFEAGLFELATAGKSMPDLVEMATALGIKFFVETKLAGLKNENIIDLFLDSEQALLTFIDFAEEKGLLE